MLIISKSNSLVIETPAHQRIAYAEESSKHRMKLPLYDLEPRTENSWIAPNATLGNLKVELIKHDIVGEVIIKRWASVWYNTVIRGDINRVE